MSPLTSLRNVVVVVGEGAVARGQGAVVEEASRGAVVALCFLSIVGKERPVHRLGWLIRFISHSVISGFTTTSAIVIGLSQAKYFLG
ncbi:hypothetical protein RJT34_03533 [Clitoria ternatea]|uniref:SLC26A/SulP transporter domain-containing protein n=1 Tax=Clitoria ternatea TaxID=43366 RepID=A0AAN9KKY1_CLITE